ncbi:MAG: flavin reductase [Marinilabiliales bacterium]|nr:flavin reductase [Marinilabiliales bacterium]
MIKPDSYFKVTYGLYLVTARLGEQKVGYVANTVFQVTSSPARFGVSCSKDNFSTSIIERSGSFAFSVLGERASTGLIGDFGYRSGREIDKFRGVNYFIGQTGSPIITDSAIAWFECRTVETLDLGSHLLMIGEVIASDVLNDQIKPLTYQYYRDVLKGFSPKNAPTYVDKSLLETNSPGMLSESEIWQCSLCHYAYETDKGDPISGIDPGTRFQDLPDDWCCPICGADKSQFFKD